MAECDPKRIKNLEIITQAGRLRVLKCRSAEFCQQFKKIIIIINHLLIIIILFVREEVAAPCVSASLLLHRRGVSSLRSSLRWLFLPLDSVAWEFQVIQSTYQDYETLNQQSSPTMSTQLRKTIKTLIQSRFLHTHGVTRNANNFLRP